MAKTIVGQILPLSFFIFFLKAYIFTRKYEGQKHFCNLNSNVWTISEKKSEQRNGEPTKVKKKKSGKSILSHERSNEIANKCHFTFPARTLFIFGFHSKNTSMILDHAIIWCPFHFPCNSCCWIWVVIFSQSNLINGYPRDFENSFGLILHFGFN